METLLDDDALRILRELANAGGSMKRRDLIAALSPRCVDGRPMSPQGAGGWMGRNLRRLAGNRGLLTWSYAADTVTITAAGRAALAPHTATAF